MPRQCGRYPGPGGTPGAALRFPFSSRGAASRTHFAVVRAHFTSIRPAVAEAARPPVFISSRPWQKWPGGRGVFPKLVVVVANMFITALGLRMYGSVRGLWGSCRSGFDRPRWAISVPDPSTVASLYSRREALLRRSRSVDRPADLAGKRLGCRKVEEHRRQSSSSPSPPRFRFRPSQRSPALGALAHGMRTGRRRPCRGPVARPQVEPGCPDRR
jgi:hypothetical protein